MSRRGDVKVLEGARIIEFLIDSICTRMVWYLGKTKERISVQTPLGKPYVVLPTLEAFSPSTAVGGQSQNQIWGICSEWKLWLLYIYLMFENDHDYKMYINDKYIGLCKWRIISVLVRKPHFPTSQFLTHTG